MASELFFGSSEIFAEPRQGRERAQVASSDITRARLENASQRNRTFSEGLMSALSR
jgi:hypothetical protein